jgi:hypothetical protein
LAEIRHDQGKQSDASAAAPSLRFRRPLHGFRFPESRAQRVLRRERPPNALVQHVIFAYSNFHEESQILKFMVDAQACFWSAEADDNAEMLKRSEFPADFLLEVTARRFELKRGVVPMEDDDFDICAYHLHDSNKERWECPKYGSMKGRRKGNKLDRSCFV